MLMQGLDASVNTECFNESDDEAFRAYRLLDDDTIQCLVRRSRAKVIVFKSIAESQNAENLLSRFPDAKAVWIYRNYPDAIASSLKKWHEHRQYLYYILHDLNTADWRAENITSENLALARDQYELGCSDATARALIWYLRTSLYPQQQLDKHARVLLVQYEHLVREPATVFERVSKYLGCRFNEKMVKHIFTTSVDKQVAIEIDPLVGSKCEELITTMNAFYEANTLSNL